MKLYHNPVSTCSQKVRLVLAEKGLEYESEVLDLLAGDQFAPDYVAKNPSAVVPTLEDGGRVFVESTLINEYLDDAYPEQQLSRRRRGLSPASTKPSRPRIVSRQRRQHYRLRPPIQTRRNPKRDGASSRSG